MAEPWIKTKEAAAHIAMTHEYLSWLCNRYPNDREKSPPHSGTGKHRAFRVSQLDRWMESRK